MLVKIIFILASFIIGSIPFGFIISKRKGVKLQEIGSGNIGATNVYRALGFRYAFLVFLLDTVKGAVPLVCGKALGLPLIWLLVFAISTVLGHIFTPFLKFRGGKGVAVSFGVILVLSPLAGILDFLLWLILVFSLKIVSIASIACAFLLPFLVFIFSDDKELIILSIILSLIIIISHQANIRRLIKGKEARISKI